MTVVEMLHTACDLTLSNLASYLFEKDGAKTCKQHLQQLFLSTVVFWRMFLLRSDTNLVVFGGATTAVNTSLGCPGAPIDLLYLPLFLGEGGCGRPREKVALLLAGRTESLRGLMGGGGGLGRDTFGLRFLRLSSIMTYSSEGLQGKLRGHCLADVQDVLKQQR